jgi:hypothetical protein
MFVGYPENHAGEVCQFLNLKTKRLISSRTAVCVHITYEKCYNLSKELISHVPHPQDEVDELTINNNNEILDKESEDPLLNLVEDIVEDEEEPPDDFSVQYDIRSKGFK